MEEVFGSPAAVVCAEMALMTVALAADVFAVSVKLGLQGASKRVRRQFEAAVTGFHVALPSAGLEIGQSVHGKFGDIVLPIGMVAFLILGLHTLAQAWRHREERRVLSGPALILAFAASIDAFTAAMALGFAGLTVWVVIPVLALTSWSAARLGFALGHRAGAMWGWRAEMIGGGLLVAMGVYMLRLWL